MSGTPPRDMLYTDPVLRDEIPEGERRYTNVYRRPTTDPSFDTDAFHWGGLTAGSPVTAFWILLAPFLLANVAGWMVRRDNRLGRIMVRLAGLAITGLFVAQAFTALVLLPHLFLESRANVHLLGLSLPVGDGELRLAVSLLTLAVCFGFYILVSRASTRSHFTELGKEQRRRLLLRPTVESMLPPEDEDTGSLSETAQWRDPAGSPITSPDLWLPHAVLHRLRRLHLAFGLGSVAFCLAMWLDVGWLLVSAIVFLALVAVAVVITSLAPTEELTKRVTAVAPLISVLMVAVVVVAVWTSKVSAWWPRGTHVAVFGIAAAVGLFAFLSLSAGIVSVGALVIATQLGAILGIAVGLVVESILGLDELKGNGAGWVAVAMLFLLLFLTMVVVWLSALPADHTSRTDRLALLRRVTLEGRWVFIWAAIFGLVAAGMAVARSPSLIPADLGQPTPDGLVYGLAIVAGMVMVLLMAWRMGRYFGLKIGALVLVGALVAVVAARYGFFTFEFLRIKINLNSDLVEIAVVLTILIPGSFMLKSIVRGFRGGEAGRRQVGILWDLGSFWPRWFHPLAPPAYGPVVVTNLRRELEEHPVDVLTAHSQGSLIAAVTIAHVEDDKRPSAFLTHGSQLGRLYPEMFPLVRIKELTDAIIQWTRVCWINLWRDTDPIGGHYVEALGDANWQVCTGTGHSGHEQTPEFTVARAQALTGSTDWPSDRPRPDCWP